MLGGIDRVGGLYLPNHSKTEREITIDSGRKVYLLTRSDPAAAGGREWQEMHGFVKLSGQDWANVWVRVSADSSLETQLALFQRVISGATAK